MHTRQILGNRGRWLTIKTARREDPCQAFQHPKCSQETLRQALMEVLPLVNMCNGSRMIKSLSSTRLQVRCGKILDFINVERKGDAWVIIGDERYPGLLPQLLHGTVILNGGGWI